MCTFLGFCNSAFTDSTGDNCENYKNKNYCSNTGGYGSGWQRSWGNFTTFAKYGETARVCPQCGCISGK